MMDEAYQRSAWDHTASLLCLMANLVRAKGQRAAKLHQFHPYEKAPPSSWATISNFFKSALAQRKSRRA